MKIKNLFGLLFVFVLSGSAAEAISAPFRPSAFGKPATNAMSEEQAFLLHLTAEQDPWYNVIAPVCCACSGSARKCTDPFNDEEDNKGNEYASVAFCARCSKPELIIPDKVKKALNGIKQLKAELAGLKKDSLGDITHRRIPSSSTIKNNPKYVKYCLVVASFIFTLNPTGLLAFVNYVVQCIGMSPLPILHTLGCIAFGYQFKNELCHVIRNIVGQDPAVTPVTVPSASALVVSGGHGAAAGGSASSAPGAAVSGDHGASSAASKKEAHKE